MKRKIRVVAASVLTLMLCALILVSSVFAGSPEKTTAELFDYGSSLTANTEIGAKDLLEMILGKPISETEGIYLNSLSGVSFRYSSFVPESNISTSYDRDRGELSVSVQSHRYTASNGLVVEWIPMRATIDGTVESLTPSGEQYVCTFEELLHTGDFYMTVDFEWNVVFPGEAVEGLLNLAHTAGSEALAEILAFESQLADYHAKLDAYRAYMAYLKAKEDFADYSALYDQYEKDYAVFLDYVDRYNDYVAQKDLYDAWEAFFAYEEFRTTKLEDYKLYVTYKNQINAVNAKLQILENLFITDSNSWQLYNSLMGGLVSQVVKEENKDLLINKGGCNEIDVDNAGESAIALRALMEPYAKLRNAKYKSEHEKTAALYAYYTLHYEELTFHFSQLCRSLNSLCDNTFLIIKLDQEGKLLHYRQFIGQLYVTATSLDDDIKRDPNWTVNKKKLNEVVEPCNIVPDNINAKPKAGDMPAVEVPPVEAVAPAPQPEGDPIRTEPKPPMPIVNEPIKPDYVADPDQGVIPPYAEDPGDEPEAAPMDVRLKSLAGMIRKGELKARALSEATNRSYSAQSQVTRLVSIDNRKLISFYAGDGKTLLSQQTIEYGASFTAYGIDTYREPDAQYFYSFDYWALPDGSRAEFVAYSDMTLVATYLTRLRSYDVTWILNGETRTARLPYGETPTCLFNVDPAPERGYRYEFSGWSPEIKPVTGDVTYQGTLAKIPLLYTVTWDLGDRIETTEVPFGEYPSYGSVPVRAADTYLYEFTGWNHSPERVEGDVTYVAMYSKVALATATDKTPYTVTHTDTALTVACTHNQADVREAARYAWEHGKDLILSWGSFSVTVEHKDLLTMLQSDCRRLGIYSKTVSEMGGDQIEFACFGLFGERVQLGLPFTLKAELDTNKASSTVWTNGEWKLLEADGIEFKDSFKLQIAPVCSIFVSANGNCNLSKIPANAQVGTLIDLKIGCTFGYEVSGARVVMADGTEVPVQNLSFYMPNGDVTVTLTVTEIIYTVTFRADGQEIWKKTYRLGDEIVLPETPEKASDDQYDYTFERWSKDLSIAMGDERDVVIDAIFTATPKTVGNPYHSGNNNNVTLTVIAPIVGGALIVLIAGGVFFLKIRKKRKLAAQSKAQTEQEKDTSEPEESTSEQE